MCHELYFLLIMGSPFGSGYFINDAGLKLRQDYPSLKASFGNVLEIDFRDPGIPVSIV